MRLLPAVSVLAASLVVASLPPASASSAVAHTSVSADRSAATLAWTQLHPATQPGTGFSQMVYDPDLGQLVMCIASSPSRGTTWTWDGDWHRLDIASPIPMENTVMAYDEAQHEIVMFGGGDGEVGVNNNTWVFRDGAWTQLHPAAVPDGRILAAPGFDRTSGRLILFGGTTTYQGPEEDTWTWDGADWTELNPAHHPNGVYGSSMAWDASRSQLILVDGAAPWPGKQRRKTWAWTGSDWAGVAVDHKPRPGALFAMTSIDGKPTMYGPWGRQTWVLDATGWRKFNRGAPIGCLYCSFAWDPNRNETILYGGLNPDRRSYRTETWQLAPQ